MQEASIPDVRNKKYKKTNRKLTYMDVRKRLTYMDVRV